MNSSLWIYPVGGKGRILTQGPKTNFTEETACTKPSATVLIQPFLTMRKINPYCGSASFSVVITGDSRTSEHQSIEKPLDLSVNLISSHHGVVNPQADSS